MINLFRGEGYAMTIDLNLALALCQTRMFLLDMPKMRYENMAPIETFRFALGNSNLMTIERGYQNDIGFAYFPGDTPENTRIRDLTNPTEFAGFMHLFDTMLLQSRPDLGADTLELCNILARTIDQRMLDKVLLSPPGSDGYATAEDKLVRLLRLAELAPACRNAVARYFANDSEPAKVDLTTWHDTVDAWLTKDIDKDIRQTADGCTIKRVYTQVALVASAFRAGVSVEAITNPSASKFSERLANFLRRRRNDFLPSKDAYYEVTRDGEKHSAIVRLSQDGQPFQCWVSPGSSLDTDMVEAMIMPEPANEEAMAAPYPSR